MDFRQVYFERETQKLSLVFFSGADGVIQKSLDPHPLMASPTKSSNSKVPEFL